MNQASLAYSVLLMCSYVMSCMAKQGFGAHIRAKLDIGGSSGVVSVGRRDFAGRAFVGAGAAAAMPVPSSSPLATVNSKQAIEWVVLFFSLGNESVSTSSKAVRSRIRQLSATWGDIVDNKPVRFAEVNCDSDPQLCVELGLDVSISRPAVVRYDTTGIPVATWQPDAGQEELAAGQASSWLRREFSASDPAGKFMALVDKAEALQHYLLAMSVEEWRIAATGFALVVGQACVVAWVIITGFDLLPDAGASRFIVPVAAAHT